ncbi:SAM-dependent methyltransferase [Streptacidiphilus pinicola]|uniref:SAM-dependent methyltransferase n=1 Tax=Streptacidiphilus pinicola TaxID=2219663 RepID=A0A2X0K6T9_9ACTN|nr:SAM-dependent methyltransferase [Streptacidiphilus pinicola]RAG84985.1 SAM-dependent methyltransferase [Streptacidiphilus pinicola]
MVDEAWGPSGWMSTAVRQEPVDRRELHTDRPQSARMYDYLLGGKTNFAPDREIAAKALEAFPGLRDVVRAGRAFLGRAADFLVREGVDQFLDIGSGIPTSPNLHEIVQRVNPAARIVYVDNDPIVLAHTRALLNSTPEGRIDFLAADLRAPEAILAHPCLVGPDAALDLDRPVALVLSAVVHFLDDEDDPYGVVRTLLDPLPSGSRLVLSHATADASPTQVGRAGSAYRGGGVGIHPRTREQFARFAEGLDLATPGIVHPGAWRPEPDAPVSATTQDGYVLVARKR